MHTKPNTGGGPRPLCVAAVIPCYNCEAHIEKVVETLPDFVTLVICVEDCSRDRTREILGGMAQSVSRLRVLYHGENQGVGGAMVTGYKAAIQLGADIIVKLDSDGQMDPKQIKALITPIIEGEADYTKGNRFFDLEALKKMPTVRLIGNAGLTFFTKVSSGYWDIFDPANGFTAIHANVANAIPLEKLHKRYFLESDMLFRLSIIRARVIEIPMRAIYAGEKSNLSIAHALMTFPILNLKNASKRIFYNYFLRGFSIGSVNALLGAGLFVFGTVFGILTWRTSQETGIPATSGSVMLSALPTILGVQFILNFFSLDMASVPRSPIHQKIEQFRIRRHDEDRSADATAPRSAIETDQSK